MKSMLLLEGSVVYSPFDMRSGYYHIELTPASKEKSAFVVGGPYAGQISMEQVSIWIDSGTSLFPKGGT